MFIADQASKMYKNVLGADVSDVLVSKVNRLIYGMLLITVFIQHPL